jgi:hypothetical protein
MVYDQIHQNTAPLDHAGTQPDLAALHQKGATDALHAELQGTTYGFLNQMNVAMGADLARPKDPTEALRPKEDPQHQAMLALGLTDVSHNPKEAGQRVAEESRSIAFESIYSAATRDNHSGMKADRDHVRDLSFSNNPALNYAQKPLAFAS